MFQINGDLDICGEKMTNMRSEYKDTQYQIQRYTDTKYQDTQKPNAKTHRYQIQRQTKPNTSTHTYTKLTKT